VVGRVDPEISKSGQEDKLLGEENELVMPLGEDEGEVKS